MVPLASLGICKLLVAGKFIVHWPPDFLDLFESSCTTRDMGIHFLKFSRVTFFRAYKTELGKDIYAARKKKSPNIR